MTAAILSIGTELTRGELVNTNATWLAERLTGLSQSVQGLEVVADDAERIQRTLARLGQAHSVVVCTGGLGPTTDDITTKSVADLLGVPLVRDQASLEAIQQRMRRAGRSVAASNAKQADFPRGAEVLPNAAGTAPGFALKLGQARAFFLPGVPHEMRQMFTEQVEPGLVPASRRRVHQVRVRTFGMPESAVNDCLTGLEAQYSVTLGYRAHVPEIDVKVLAEAPSAELAEERAQRAAQEVITRLGDRVVFGTGDLTLPEVLGRLLLERGQRLALAESCTGGLVGSLLTDAAGASAYFAGGAVTYSNTAKQQVLGVDPSLLDDHGAVSSEVARAMAVGAMRAYGTELGLSLTGIAGPTGGTPAKPVGLVHGAVATSEGIVDQRWVLAGSRAQVRRRAAFAGLALARAVLLHGLAGAAE